MNLRHLTLFFLLPVLILASCKKDEMLTDSSAKLDFSTDSVLFDTVFHYAGSTTKLFRIYNKHSQPMIISKVYLAGGTSSNFQLNIDGLATTVSSPILKDIEISNEVLSQTTCEKEKRENKMLKNVRDNFIFV
jgi:hypothetical protein